MVAPAPTEARWRRVFRDLPREHGFEPLEIEGRLPPALRGTLYRNGPASFQTGGEPLRHWFDGDGAVSAVRIGNGAAQGAVRYVDTPWRRAEQAAGRRLYRNYAQLGAGWRRWFALPKNTANISVLPWNGGLHALFEAGRPVALDPDTLAAHPNALAGVGPSFSAHPHRVGDRLLNFGVRWGPTFHLDLYEVTDRAARVGTVPLRFPTLLHDFAATERHFVFFCPPVRLAFARLLTGQESFEENLHWEPERGTEVIVVSRADPRRVVRFEVPAFFLWHVVHAWEEGEDIVVDYLRHPDFGTNAWFGRLPWEDRAPPRSDYVRARIVGGRLEEEVLASGSFEFPGLDPRQSGPVREAFAVDLHGRTLVRLRPDTVTPLDSGPHTLPTEPVLAPDADGHPWLLAQLYDGERDQTCVLVADPTRWEDGPVAKLWFDHHLPFTFHGAWSPAH